MAPPRWTEAHRAGLGDRLAMERALFRPAEVAIPPPAEHESFHWILRPPDGLVEGTVYTDGSRREGRDRRLARNGWSFVAVDDGGNITAIARGVPPPWITDIPGAEAWAVLQAAMRSMGTCKFLIDCKPCVTAIHRGKKWATAGNRQHARVHGLISSAVEDMPPGNFCWMPAHTRPEQVGVALKGDGTRLTADDRWGNGVADTHAKEAVEEHRVPLDVRKKIAQHDKEVKQVAAWIGLATHRANHLPEPPYRDSTASRAAAAEARRLRRAANGGRQKKNARPLVLEARPPALGGHVLRRVARGWRCEQCRRSTASWSAMATKRCSGSAAEKWAKKAEELAVAGCVDGGGHCRQLSGQVIWCARCGAYATDVAKGLTQPCPGKREGWKGGGRHQQLLALRGGRHPRTGEWIGPPVSEAAWIPGAAGPTTWAYTAGASGRRRPPLTLGGPRLGPTAAARESAEQSARDGDDVAEAVGDSNVQHSEDRRTCADGQPTAAAARLAALRRRVVEKCGQLDGAAAQHAPSAPRAGPPHSPPRNGVQGRGLHDAALPPDAPRKRARGMPADVDKDDQAPARRRNGWARGGDEADRHDRGDEDGRYLGDTGRGGEWHERRGSVPGTAPPLEQADRAPSTRAAFLEALRGDAAKRLRSGQPGAGGEAGSMTEYLAEASADHLRRVKQRTSITAGAPRDAPGDEGGRRDGRDANLQEGHRARADAACSARDATRKAVRDGTADVTQSSKRMRRPAASHGGEAGLRLAATTVRRRLRQKTSPDLTWYETPRTEPVP